MNARRGALVFYGATFVVLATSIFLTHATGEGDATLHFLNARAGVNVGIKELMSSWARPLFKLLMVGPAWLGMEWARLTMAVLATVLAWQTIGLARDLKLARPLLAGFFLVAQPMTFFASQDVLTEIPTALATYTALRLWLHRRFAWSCLVVSLTPTLRPEGFFFIAVWGGLLLVEARRRGSPRFAFSRGVLLGVGMSMWVAASWLIVNNPRYPFQSFWPLGGWGYGSGHLWDYLGRWPWFLGAALFPLFLVALFTAWRRELTLIWLLWWLVLGVHSVLWAGGWFASAGLMRILVTTAPSAALLCLAGFNSIACWLERRAAPRGLMRTFAVVFFAWAAEVAAYRYATELDHQDEKVAWPAAEFIAANHLLSPDTSFFASNMLMLIALDYPKQPLRFVENKWGRDAQSALLKALPPGSIGVWDNGRSNYWIGVSIDDLDSLGYERLAEFSEQVWVESPWYMYQPWRGPDSRTIRYVVVRKRGIVGREVAAPIE